MTELRFRTDLYSNDAIDVAVAAYASFATIERAQADGVEILRVAAFEGEDEKYLAGEIANYVLGATVDGEAKQSVAKPKEGTA